LLLEASAGVKRGNVGESAVSRGRASGESPCDSSIIEAATNIPSRGKPEKVSSSIELDNFYE
jgi:hypothetical protein